MAPHQERVIFEQAELAERIAKLSSFIGSKIYNDLVEAEQDRLSRQLGHMQAYNSVLEERIGAFW